MDDKLSKMYDDFFGTPLTDDTSKEENTEKEEERIDIDSLLIDDASRELLKRIVLYMDNYNNSKVPNYITFNILLNCDNKETIDMSVEIHIYGPDILGRKANLKKMVGKFKMNYQVHYYPVMEELNLVFQKNILIMKIGLI